MPLFAYGAVAAAVFSAVYVLQRALFTPLAKIPNAHPLAPYTGLWILWVRYTERVNITVYHAHKRHGHVVRLGPSELSIAMYEDGVKTVYSNKKFTKHVFYRAFWNFGVAPMFGTFDAKRHTEKRKRVSNVYSKSYLQGSDDLQAILEETVLRRLLPKLAKAAELEGVIDVFPCNQAVTLDAATCYSWGLQNGTKYLLDDEGRAAWQNMYVTSRPPAMMFLPVELPGLTQWLARFAISPLPREAHYYNDVTDAWLLSLCDKAEATLASGDYDARGHLPTVYRQLKESIAKEPQLSASATCTSYRTSPAVFRRHKDLDDVTMKIISTPRSPAQIDAAAELLDEIVATNDVMGMTLNYICWQLSKNPEWQKKLHEEMMSISRPMMHPSTSGTLPPAKELDQLPVLYAVVQETMRLNATNPGQEPRYVTRESGTITLGKFHGIPVGTRVSANPYSLHRDPNVFPEPESWRPERWLPKAEDKGRWAGDGQADKFFWGFSSGPRMCIGNNLSYHLINYFIGSMYTNFKTSVVDDEGMDEQLDGFIAGPKAERLILKIERWD